MEKIHLYVWLFLIPALVRAQEPKVKEIAPVVVESNKKFFSDDHPTLTIVSEGASTVTNENIGYLLQKKSSVIVRSYGGYGSLTSVSMHGTGSNHTQVTWNGIPLNSPTTGMVDLSLLPSAFIQRIDIVDGASGSLFGSGTFGGSVNLGNEADWNNRFSARYSFNFGSYGNIGHGIMLHAGGGKIQYHLTLLRTKAENDFHYRDNYSFGSPLRKNSNNQYSDAGVMQNVYVNAGKGNYIEAGVWYQEKKIGIPAIMGTTEPGNAQQKDSLFRTYLNYKKKGEKSAFQIRSAWLSDFLNYVDGDRNQPSFIDSKISSFSFLNEADYRHFITGRFIAGGGISYSVVNGKSENYGGTIRENETALYGNLKYILKNWIINAGFRKEFYKFLNPVPQYSVGIRYKIQNDVIIRAAFSTKFRKPSLNEKYWNPGGNPDLRPEKGMGGEISGEWNFGDGVGEIPPVSAKITVYYQTVANWIQWIVKDSLTPVEYKTVHAGGIDSRIDCFVKVFPFTVSGFVNYSYNRSVIAETYNHSSAYKGNQLMYIPRHSSKASVLVQYSHYLFDLTACYTGMRETTETADKNLRLPSYMTVDASLGFFKNIGNIPLGIRLRCDNLFNRQYEIIRSYPVPGRTVHLMLSLGINKTSQP